MTTENIRADALADALNLLRETQKTPPNYGWALRRDSFLQSITAPPAEPPAAAPIDERVNAARTDSAGVSEIILSTIVRAARKGKSYVEGYGKAHQFLKDAGLLVDGSAATAPAPSPADERTAFDADDLDFEPDAQHTVADMANIGYALLEQIARMAPGYHWNESPAEIVSDLINERGEARTASPTETGTKETAVPPYLDIVFDGPESGRFVEVEFPAGRSVSVGRWIKRDDGYWVLRIEPSDVLEPGEGAIDV